MRTLFSYSFLSSSSFSIVVLATLALSSGCSAQAGDENVGESSDALTTKTEILCESQNRRYKSCEIDVSSGGRVVNARIVEQFSSASCVEGRTWGYEPTYLWVHQGCRAAFEVSVWRAGPPAPVVPEIIMFQDRDFGGNTRTLKAAVSDFDDIGFDNKVSSIIVRSGKWELCQHDNFDGVCLQYGPGEYATVTMNDSFGSARPVR